MLRSAKHFDLALFNAFRRLWSRSRFLDALGIFVANALTYFLVAAAVILLFRVTHSDEQRVFVVLEVLLTLFVARGVLTIGIQQLTRRQRPFKVLGFMPPLIPVTSSAFPSGHMSALFGASAVIFALDPHWGVIHVTLSALVGIGRIFVGVHWPSDVIVGIIIGLVSGFLIHAWMAAYGQAFFGQWVLKIIEISPWTGV